MKLESYLLLSFIIFLIGVCLHERAKAKARERKRPKRLSAKGKVTIKQDLDLTKKFYHD